MEFGELLTSVQVTRDNLNALSKLSGRSREELIHMLDIGEKHGYFTTMSVIDHPSKGIVFTTRQEQLKVRK